MSNQQQVMSPDSTTDKVVRLVGPENYGLWKFQIKILLKSHGVYEIVTGGLLKPVKLETETDQVFNTRLSIWTRQDLLAQRIISTSITEKALLFIINCETAKDMWSKFENVLVNNSETNVHLLQQKFYNVQFEPQEGVAVFVSNLENLSHKLAVLGSPIPENMVITKILMSLPEHLKYFVSAWESTSIADRTLTNLMSRLISEELRNETDEKPVAFVSKSENNSNVKNDKLCFVCKKPGHFKKDCWLHKKRLEKRNKAGPSRGDKKNKESEALMVTGFDENDSNYGSWFLDSGATDHMTNNFKYFSTYNVFPSPVFVKIGNGSLIKALGKGRIRILSHVGSEIVACHLENVLYVPEIRLNLVSLGSVMGKGFEFYSNYDGCALKKNNVTFVVGVSFRNLFKLSINVDFPKEICASVAITDMFRLWHSRLGHQNQEYVKDILKLFNKSVPCNKDFFCENCKFGKQTRLPFGEGSRKTTKIGELIHSDVCGPMQVDSIGGSRYFVTFKDDFSKYKVVNFIRQKSEVFEKFKDFCLCLKKETGNNVSILRSDQGTEYKNKNFEMFLKNNGIKHEESVVYTPEQNGASERENRTIVEAARTMIHAKGLNINLWAEAVNTAVYVLNRTYINKVSKITSYEMWHKIVPSIDHFRVFGTDTYCHIPKQKRQKWDIKSHKGVFVGYSNQSKGYRIYFPDTGKIEICRDVEFHDELNKSTCVKDNSENNGDFLIQILTENQEQDNVELIEERNVSQDSRNDTESESEYDSATDDVFELDENLSHNRRSGYFLRNRHTAMIAESDEPQNYTQAIRSDNKVEWKKAMEDEYSSLIRNNTWELVEKPMNKKKLVTRLPNFPDRRIRYEFFFKNIVTNEKINF